MSLPLTIRAVPRWVPVAALALLAIALRFTYVWQVHGTSLVRPDDLDPGFYYNWAKEIAAGAWLGSTPFVQSPLYAYLLALMMKIPLVGTHVGRILALQSLLGCGTVLLTYVAGRRLFDHAHGIVAGLLVALYAPFLFYEGMIMKTFLSPFLTILLVILFDRARERASGPLAGAPEATGAGAPAGAGRAFLLTGAAYGLTTLDRDNFILLAPVLAGLALVLGGGWSRRGLRAAGAFALGASLVILPVTLRNFVVSREFVLLTTGGGEVFFIGNNADANGLYVPPAFVRPDPRYEHADFIDRASEIAGQKLSPMQSSWFWFREGLRYIADSPLGWCRLLLRKTFFFWNYYELPDNVDYEIMQRFSPLLARLNGALPPGGWPTIAVPFEGGWRTVRLHLLVTFGSLAPLGLAGLYLTRRSFRRLVPLYVLLFGYMGTVLLFFNFSRFRVPVVPILALFAAESLMAIGRWLKRPLDLAIAFAARSGEMARRARALLPGPAGRIACALLAVTALGVNVEVPRGVVPAIEQALIMGNAYYEEGRSDEALRSYMLGLVLLGEGPPGAEGERLVQGLGPGVTRAKLARELEVESIARGPQFKGIHIGIHHGLGIAWLQKAQRLLDGGDRRAAMPLIDRAIGQFQEALVVVPSYQLSLRKLARAYALKGDHQTAVEYLKKASDLWPDDAAAALELAEALYDGGEFKEALEALDQVRRVNPHLERRDLSQIFMNRGLIFSRGLGQPGRALFCFEKALELDPDHPQAAEIRRTILDLRARGLQPLADDLYEKPGTGHAPAHPPAPPAHPSAASTKTPVSIP